MAYEFSVKQKFYKIPQEKRSTQSRSKYVLQVVRIRGPRKGQPYTRSFSSASDMAAYKKRHTGAGSREQAVGSFENFTPKQLQQKKQTLLNDLKGWAMEGLGLGGITKDEREYLNAFKEGEGRTPKPWEDPYLMDRTGKFIDKTFTALAVAAGPGIALKGVQAAIQGTKLATKAAARAVTKAALKRAIKTTATELTKKATVKNTLARAGKYTIKGGGKALHHEYEMSVLKEYKKMFKKGVNSVFK